MNLGEAFIQRIDYYLNEKGVSRYKFTKRNDINYDTIKSIKRGLSKNPTLKTLFQVARGFGVTPMEFLDCDLFKSEELDFE